MKIKNFFTILVILFSCQLILGATTNIVDINYNFSNNSHIDNNIHEAESVIIRVNTPIDTICYYTENEGFLPNKNFDGNYGTKHEKVLENLEEGVHNYYIFCGEDFQNMQEKTMKVNFKTIVPISGVLEISKDPPLKEGQYEIKLTTSKPCLEEPDLQYTLDDYTFDGITYMKVELKGSGKNWQGYLIIPGNAGEVVGSFIFKGTDLAGRIGTKITGDNLFIVDTVNPETIEIIESVGYQGQIKLNWFYNSEVKEFNIYKSENPQVEYTDYYETTSKKYFTDNDVEKGKTYYYRVAGVDNAGNIAKLSKEIYATALYNNASSIQTGLQIKLVGKVDNLLAEINSLIEDINNVNKAIGLKEELEKSLFEDIKLNKENENAILELNSLKRDVEKYKLQDLTEEELDKKISSSNLKINIIKKKVPENLIILDKKEINREINEENIQKAFLEYLESSETQDSNNKKEIQKTLEIVKDKNIKITSKFYSVEILYLDGTKKDITIVKEFLDSEIEIIEDFFYVFIIPKDIAERASELKIMNPNYEIIKEDPVISFNSDTKRVTYYISKEIDLNSLEKIIVSPIQFLEETSRVTGNVISEYISGDSIGLIILLIFVSALIVYLLILRFKSKNKLVKSMISDIEKIEKLIKENKKEEAKEVYLKLKEDYKNLSEENKEKVSIEVEKLNEGLLK